MEMARKWVGKCLRTYFPEVLIVAKGEKMMLKAWREKQERLEPQNRTKIVKKPKFHGTTPTKQKKTTSPLQTEALACHEEEAEGDEEGGEVAGHHVVPVHHPHPPGGRRRGRRGEEHKPRDRHTSGVCRDRTWEPWRDPIRPIMHELVAARERVFVSYSGIGKTSDGKERLADRGHTQRK